MKGVFLIIYCDITICCQIEWQISFYCLPCISYKENYQNIKKHYMAGLIVLYTKHILFILNNVNKKNMQDMQNRLKTFCYHIWTTLCSVDEAFFFIKGNICLTFFCFFLIFIIPLLDRNTSRLANQNVFFDQALDNLLLKGSYHLEITFSI